MKEFSKYVLATITGLVIFGIIICILSILSLAGMVASGTSETSVKKNTVMVLKLGSVSERSTDNPINVLMGQGTESTGLNDILSAIKKAASNDKIKGIYIEGDASTAMSPATAEAIRHQLLDFKKSKKFIISYADTYSRNAYYIASVADKVMLNPQGQLEWGGLAGQTMYYKDALDKLGIQMEVFKVGTYKSAVEPYLLNEMSDANREQISSYLGDIWQQTLKDVSASRKISADSLNAYANRGILFSEATEYLKLKLVDKLIYAPEVETEIKDLMKLEKDDNYNKLTIAEMAGVKNAPNKNKDGKIAVYYAVGQIGGGSTFSNDEVIDQKKVVKDLRKIKDDKDIKAVVFRVNSPGGSAFDSEQIWKAVTELKAEKPVVVSMGDYAASGGYYISCAADYIFAEATTLTGSIGIFGMFPQMGELLNNKLGVHFSTVKTNEYSDLGDISRPMTEAERAIMQNNVNRGYELFTKRCADGRKMKQDDIKKIGEGRVWTGVHAKQIGLVDELGGLDAAIAKAKKLAKLDEASIMNYPAKSNVLDQLMEEMQGNSYADKQLKQTLGDYYPIFTDLKNIGQKTGIQASMPYFLKFRL